MMSILFLIILTFSLIIFQTIVLPCFSWFPLCFDLLIMNVLFLSLVYSHFAVVLAIIFIGVIMDSLSGAAFFHHVFSYLWIYLIVQLFKQFVFHQSVIFILIISVVSVLIQQGLMLFSVFIQQGSDAIWQMNYTVMFWQIFWGGVFIPPGVWAINAIRHYWMYVAKMLKRQFAQKHRV